MSKYDSFQTTLTEEAPLVAALQALGYPVEIHTNGAPLFGYQGDERPERAHIIIRRQHLSSSANDIGFERGADGRFRAIVSEYDRSSGFGDAWLGRVHQRYKEERTLGWRGRKRISSAAAK